MQFLNLKLFFSFSLLILSGCAHTVSFRSSHFATPVTSHKQWGGRFAAVAANPTRVTLINDAAANQPTRDGIAVNQDVSLLDVLLLSQIGFDLALSPLDGLDLFAQTYYYGFNWQFLNHGAKANSWVGALRGAYGAWSSNSSSSDVSSGAPIKSETSLVTAQAGASLGYKVSETFVPYASYIYENHDAKTNVNNQYGSFGPYEDRGVHQYLSLGITTDGPGFDFGLEYNMINIKWDKDIPSTKTTLAYQNTLGIRLGFAW